MEEKLNTIEEADELQLLMHQIKLLKQKAKEILNHEI